VCYSASVASAQQSPPHRPSPRPTTGRPVATVQDLMLAMVDQHSCIYRPRVVGARVGQAIESLIETTTSSLGGNIDERQVQELPSQGRNWMSLALLAPGNRTNAQGSLPVQDSGFTAHVPKGSVAKGKALVESGGSGRTIACSICHGDALKGLGNVPRIAGLHPIYIARQLYLFKDGTRNGVDAQLMKKPVAHLSDEDILALAAYLASLAP
jgi:cytochrome c553